METINKFVLRKYIIQVLFLQNHILKLQPREEIDGLQKEVALASSDFFSMLLSDEISNEQFSSFEKRVEQLLEDVFEEDHESHNNPSMEETLSLEYEIEKRKYFKETNEAFDREFSKTHIGIGRKNLMASENIVSSLDELFKDG